MELNNFRKELSLDIINQYINARDNYNHLIYVAKRMIQNNHLSLIEKENMQNYISLLRVKRNKVQAAIAALKKRHSIKPVYEYTNQAKYKVIGEETSSKHFQKRLKSLDKMQIELDELRRDRQLARLIYDNNLYGRIRTKIVQNKIKNLKKKIGTVQNFQRKILLEKSKVIGCQKFGMISQSYSKKQRKIDRFIEGLKSLQALNYETHYAENFEDKKYVLNKSLKN